MDSAVLSAISSVGFPIVAYFWLVTKSDKKSEKLTEAVNNNTLVLQEFVASMKKS